MVKISDLIDESDPEEKDPAGNGGKTQPESEKKHILVRHKTVEEIVEEEGIKISKIPGSILALLIILVIITGTASALAFFGGHGNNYLYGFTALVYAIFITILVVK